MGDYTYDANFDLASSTDARGNTTTYCYDTGYNGQATTLAYGNLTRTISPPPASGQAPLASLAKYDTTTGQGTAVVVDNLVETVAPKGVGNGAGVTCSTDLSAGVNTTYATDYAYDASKVFLQSVTQRFTDPDKGLQTATTTYQYGDAANPGAVTAVVPPLGGTHTTTYAYYGSGGQAGMLQQTKDSLGDTISYTYDAIGRRLTMTDPMQGAWSYSYDNEDRLTQTKTPSVNGSPLVTSYQYDPVGNRTVVVDAAGQVTKYLYDARDSLAEVDQSPNTWTDPNAQPSPLYRTTYTYDNNGNLSRIDRATGDTANERATDYTYDGLNRLRTETQYPAWPGTSPTLVTKYTYDGDNNRVGLVNPLNQTTTYGFDADNRLTSITYSDGTTPNVSYTYDANGSRLTMGDGTGNTTYAYDERNRLTSVTQGDGQVIGYRYDTDGNRSELIYPGSGHVVTYAYDNADRLQTVTDWSNRVSSYSYYADGLVQKLTNVDGSTATYTYDPAQRLTQVNNQTSGGAVLDQHIYTLDPLGNPTQRQETLAQVGGGSASATTLYSYDKLSELTAAGPSGSQTTYCYDPVGNRVSTTAGCAPTITYDKADRIQQSGATAYAVNADGDVTARGSDTFAYDQANRIASAAVGGTATTFTYSGDGLRMAQTMGSTTTHYLWDVDAGLPQLLADGARFYIYGLGLTYSVDGSNNVQVYHADGLGSVRALTDGTGTLTAAVSADAFGADASQQGTNAQPFGYTGQQVDTDGLVYLRARYYDPALGRFMTRDTYVGSAALPLSLNRYTYVGNDPTARVDPTGADFLGTYAHGLIEQYFINFVMPNQGYQSEVRIPPNATSGFRKLDLVRGSQVKRQYYFDEIKPENQRKDGVKDILFDINFGAQQAPPYKLIPDPNSFPDFYIPNALPGWQLHVWQDRGTAKDPAQADLILYRWEREPLLIPVPGTVPAEDPADQHERLPEQLPLPIF